MIPNRTFRSRHAYLALTLLALAAGAILRIGFIHYLGQVYGDSIIYGDIASNWLLHGVYGYATVAGTSTVAPTLIRLPGYPAFLVVVFKLFGIGNFNAVLWIQALFGLGTCLLVAGFVSRAISRRAGQIALWLAALCPFTANYVALPLTETLSIFCVALSLYCYLRLTAAFDRRSSSLKRHSPEQGSEHEVAGFAASDSRSGNAGSRREMWFWVVISALAWSYGALLRPEGALLAMVLFFALIGHGWKAGSLRRALRPALVCGLLSVLPFIPWTVRNWRTFHVFQPLAPRSAEDPGVFTAPGFDRWTRTWMVDFASVYEIGWNVPGSEINLQDLPSRAFDSAAEYEQTRQLFEQYNLSRKITPAMDVEFARLAAERIRAHPFRYYVLLPVLRLTDMWLRPRLDTMDVHLRWWQFSRHKVETTLAAAYGALNLLYLIAALIGAFAWRRARAPVLTAMVVYVLLRCLALLTVGPESRYTLEFFPIVFSLAAAALNRRIPATGRSSTNLPRQRTVQPTGG